MAESSNQQSGADVRRKVLGDAYVDRLAATRDPFLAPFSQMAIEHGWGAAWTRPGLDVKYRSLVVVSALAALGREHELRIHFRGALNVGWTADELREACLQVAVYAGFPAALDALTVLAEVVKQVESERQ
jgi:4-carboxymuconolactone decarboxylase